jgi:hypothetical protein
MAPSASLGLSPSFSSPAFHPQPASAVALAACMIQMLDTGMLHQSGLHLMRHFLNPGRFLDDVAGLGTRAEQDPEEPQKEAIA